MSYECVGRGNAPSRFCFEPRMTFLSTPCQVVVKNSLTRLGCPPVTVAVKIPKVEIPIGQNPDSRNPDSRNPERSKSRTGQNPEGSKSRIGRKCTVKCGLASVVH
ncbi:hypothetical protein M513_11099 [Trichuris suis]|uniref:Uncharacterized protein n=1 Tax=Trichuris suis TaxID=68888 RepID=A0A085LSS1_9BILA|nr:hypothetical protein M513_11099 [Trichuris suis]